MNACPHVADAARSKAEVRMGLARMSYDRCLRTRGEECRICVDLCPIGQDALIIHEGRVQVMITGCVGCGVCEQQCPTRPKAIEVVPA